MTRNILLTSIFICCTLCGTAQQMTEQDYIRSGNKFYADSLFEKAEVEYRKALEINSASTDALYNLGNAYRKSGDNANAVATYQQVIELFPNTEKANRSQSYINEMTAENE